jgi:peptidoglycan hydrolase-like protein with peptidoglycan-binding domain
MSVADRARRPSDAARPRPDRVDAPDQTDPMFALQSLVGNQATAALVQRLAEDAPEEEELPASAGVIDMEPERITGDPGGLEADEPAPASTTHPTVRRGSRGASVVECQEKLNAHGAEPALNPDGVFGPLTQQAAVAFQTRTGLDPDGIVGPLTWTELDKAPGGDGPEPTPERLPLYSPGDEGPDIALLQQRLNAADATVATKLDITGVYDDHTDLAVYMFQTDIGIVPQLGFVDQETWDRLAERVPQGGHDEAGNELHVDTGDAVDPMGRQVAGTTLHPDVGPGTALVAGPAVEEFQKQLDGWRRRNGKEAIVTNGVWATETGQATIDFQRDLGLEETGRGDQATWSWLDATSPAVDVGYVERQWTEEVGGHTYTMTGGSASRYSWRILPDRLQVTVKVDFTGNAAPAAWFGYVPAAWNKYKAVNADTGDELPICFEMVQGTGADAMSVAVKTGTGRANAGEWYLGDSDAANTVPHEYGHLIGLRDEYQVHAGDYREITGHEPPAGDVEGPTDATPEEIAAELQGDIVARSAAQANAHTVGRGVTMGGFAARIVAAYQELPSVDVAASGAREAGTTTRDVVRDLDQFVPEDTGGLRYATIQALTYSSGSIMGDPSRVTDPHDHGAQPRHVQEFIELLAQLRGGTWTAVAR